MKDFTKEYDYEHLIAEEKNHYSKIEITKDLKEGGVHSSSAWHYYWTRVGQVLNSSQFANMPAYLSRTLAHLQRPIYILSLGSGYCGHELGYARSLTHSYRIRCTDINTDIFEKAKEAARNENLTIEFEQADLNFIRIEPGRYDLIFAHASMHHVVNLEHLFAQIAGGLTDGGVFQMVEVVGEDRNLLWPESERLLNALLDALPDSLTDGFRSRLHQKPSLRELLKQRAKALFRSHHDGRGMEGIRQSQIIPLLRQHFVSLFEHRHGAFMRFICTDPTLSTRFNPQNPEARRYLDFLMDIDQATVRHGVLQPLEIWGVYSPNRPMQPSSGVA